MRRMDCGNSRIACRSRRMGARMISAKQGFLWLVFQMPVRYTDFGGDTGGSSDRTEKDLFHPDYHRDRGMGS